MSRRSLLRGVLSEEEGGIGGLVLLNTESFSSGFGLWNTPGVDQPESAWSRTTGATPTSSAGPNGGANPANRAVDPANAYAFTEANDAAASPWTLESPVINVSETPAVLTFDLFFRFGTVGGILDGTFIVQGWNGVAWSQIGPSIIGSKQTTANDNWLPSSDFGQYTSQGFTNSNFKFRFFCTRGGSQFFANYDFCVDNVALFGGDGTLTPVNPPSTGRSDGFNTGLRRLHVSKGGAPPLDGTTPDLSFSTIQAALNVMQAGDVITIGDGEYAERPNVSGRSGTVDLPIWIAAENPHAVIVTDYWVAARNGTQAWTLENGSTGRYSASHGNVYMGVHNNDFLPKYSSVGNLDATSVNGVTKPVQGLAFANGRVHIRLKGAQNPNGQNIFITETTGRDVITLNDCDNIIVDGLRCEGGGQQSGIKFNQSSDNPVIINCRSDTSRFLCRVPSNAIVDYNTYTLGGLTGGKNWMRECVSLNGNERAAFFDLIKGDLAQGGNAVYEGGIAVGAGGFQSGAIHTNCIFKRNLMIGVFDGERFGEFRNSETFFNFYDEMGDDGIQFEDDRNSNNGNNNRAYFNFFRNPHGPVFSHQNNGAATHFVIRNVVQITEPNLFRPEFLIKTIRTQAGSTIRYAHNYMENFSTAGTRSPWYPFSTPGTSGGDEIDTFLNNIVVFPGGINPTLPQSAGSPGDADGNALVNNTPETSLQGANGVYVGTVKSLLNIDADFTLQLDSPARGIGQSLPGGFVDPITTGNPNEDAGAYPFNFDLGTLDIRDPLSAFNDSELPDRWTSPGQGNNAQFPAPRFGGQFSSWGIPASEIATHPNSSTLVAQIYNATNGRINSNIDRFTPVIYDLQDANSNITFDRTTTNFGGNLNDGAQIPWNFSQFDTPGDFDPSDGDSYTILVDSQTGLCYEFFQSRTRFNPTRLEASRGTLMKTGVDNDGPNANIFTKQNVNRNSRACGIQHVVGLILRSEIDAGRIPHCMTLSYPNPTQFAHEAPAIKGAGNTGGPAGRGFMGLRIVWDLTDQQIEDWLLTRPSGTRNALRIVANCIREFGMMGTDHSGSQSNPRGATQWEHDLSANWSQVGISQDNSLTALHSLLQGRQSQARVLDIPVHADGTDATVACYPNVPYPGNHPCNGVV